MILFSCRHHCAVLPTKINHNLAIAFTFSLSRTHIHTYTHRLSIVQQLLTDVEGEAKLCVAGEVVDEARKAELHTRHEVLLEESNYFALGRHLVRRRKRKESRKKEEKGTSGECVCVGVCVC